MRPSLCQTLPLLFPCAAALLLVPLAASATEADGVETQTVPGRVETTSPPENPPPTAPPSPEAIKQTDSETDRKIEILAAEIERLRLGEVTPKATAGVHGLGPAASKVYRVESGVSIGGYGELLYQNDLAAEGSDTFDFYRNVIYLGYKFDDRFVLNTEIELEHVKEIALEFATLDFLWKPELGFRAGLLLLPMGLVNELHEPTTFLGALRPETEREILPSTWRENGLGVFGEVGPIAYRAYVLNGMDAAGLGGTRGLRGGRQKGGRAKVNDVGAVLRADYVGLEGLLAGGSIYHGGADQGAFDFQVTNLIYEAHLDFAWRGLKLRALYAGARITGAQDLSTLKAIDGDPAVPASMQGFYLQAAYDLLSAFEAGELSLTPYLRYEFLDTQATMPAGFATDPAARRTYLTAGLAFAPTDPILLKAEWQRTTDAGGRDDSSLNVVLAYIF